MTYHVYLLCIGVEGPGATLSSHKFNISCMDVAADKIDMKHKLQRQHFSEDPLLLTR